MTNIVQSVHENHAELLDLFKQEKCTSGFGNILYSAPTMYEKGWIWEARDAGQLVGAYCVRQCTRKPQTSLYFIAVHKDCRRLGYASDLLDHIKANSPSGRIVLSVNLDNTPARTFYLKHGFVETTPAFAGKGVNMQWDL